MQKPLRKIDDIEMLRGFAMILILVGHACGSLIPWTSPFWVDSIMTNFYHYLRGASGVDLFFAISGFVISRDLYPKLTSCTSRRSYMDISLAFWIRRIWRIFPSAWLWLAVILLCSAFFNKSGVFHSFKINLDGTVAAVFQYHNYWINSCYMSECSANFYYWTLSLEEQFYLLLPFTIFLLRRWFPYALAYLIIAQLLSPYRTGIMVVFRTDALLLGVLIALWSQKPSYLKFESCLLSASRWVRIPIILGLFSAMVMDGRIAEGILAPFSYGIIALVCAGLVLIGSYDKNHLLAPGYLKRLLMWLGSRSCSLYLVHIPAFYLVREIWFRSVPAGTQYEVSYTLPFVLSAVFAVFLLGELSYRYVETPSRRKGTDISSNFLRRRMSQQQVVPQVSETTA